LRKTISTRAALLGTKRPWRASKRF